MVQAATREGAHAAALEGSAPQDGVATARRLISASLGQFGANVELDASSDDEVAVVAASGSMRPILPLPVLGQSLPLGARAIAYREMFRP